MGECKTGVEWVMAGIEDRVKGFLDSWPIIREQLEEIEDEGLFHSQRTGGPLRGERKDDLQAPLGKGDPGL